MKSKIDQEFKDEVNDQIRKGSYITTHVLCRVAVSLIIAIVLIGLISVGYTLTIHKMQKNADREVFKSSIAYTEESAQFLAKSYKEYNEADKDDEKKAIMEYVSMRYPNLDIDSIENEKLKNFYLKCID